MVDNFTHFPLFAPGFDPTWGSDPTRPCLSPSAPLTICASHPPPVPADLRAIGTVGGDDDGGGDIGAGHLGFPVPHPFMRRHPRHDRKFVNHVNY